jgi:hypothetical protein
MRSVTTLAVRPATVREGKKILRQLSKTSGERPV